MADSDKFSVYDTKADINDLGVGSSVSNLSDRSRDTRYLEGNTSAVGRKQVLGVHNDHAWKGGCQVEGCSKPIPNRMGLERFTNKATHLVTTMNDGEVSMKKVCGKHADECHFTAQSEGHNVLTGVEQASGTDLSKPTTIVARLTRRTNDAWRVHNGLEPETKTNVNGTGANRKIVKSTPRESFVRTGSSWVPESSVQQPEVEKPKRGRPVGSGDSKPRKKMITKAELYGDQPKRGRGRPAGSKNGSGTSPRKKKAAAAPITRMVNGREMTVTVIPENKRATERGMKLSRNGRNYKGSGTAV